MTEHYDVVIIGSGAGGGTLAHVLAPSGQRMQRISDVLADRGYQPFHAPCGILLDEAGRPASSCIRCAWCDGYPCLVHAKADAETIAVRPLLTQPNVTLLVGAEVTALRTDQAGGTVTGVEISRYGKKETYAGDIVVVAAGAANSARILLRSVDASFFPSIGAVNPALTVMATPCGWAITYSTG